VTTRLLVKEGPEPCRQLSIGHRSGWFAREAPSDVMAAICLCEATGEVLPDRAGTGQDKVVVAGQDGGNCLEEPLDVLVPAWFIGVLRDASTPVARGRIVADMSRRAVMWRDIGADLRAVHTRCVAAHDRRLA
jgi:hypothetical protein